MKQPKSVFAIKLAAVPVLNSCKMFNCPQNCIVTVFFNKSFFKGFIFK